MKEPIPGKVKTSTTRREAQLLSDEQKTLITLIEIMNSDQPGQSSGGNLGIVGVNDDNEC